jgi:DNA segregation ATPase FtsK/SpoIIIE-like protein
VVTEPAKAVRALKWAVEEMERRYRMMSEIACATSGFNEKVRAAQAKGKPLGRRIQIGFDPDTGEELYEENQLDYEPLPQIVLIVDELADLMVTVGKEIEVLIQRLSQKSRAAGIHLIMATQRPSVDVITGVIKANLPTRISFAVTSRIDSRTILGEQGAEQLLGKGDMLYKPNTDPIRRVHGPFVSDEEVEAVADHWRTQGSPTTSIRSPRNPKTAASASTISIPHRTIPKSASTGRSASWCSKARRPRPAGSSARWAWATTPRPSGSSGWKRTARRPGQPRGPARDLPRQGRQSVVGSRLSQGSRNGT